MYSIGIPIKYKYMKIKHWQDNKKATTHGATGKRLLKWGNDVKVK